jgi:SET domain-containing protein
VLVPIKDLADGLKNPTLNKYFYLWTKTHVAVCLGYGLLYNHSYEPNAVYEHGVQTMTYRALRDIAEGEEVTINYNFDPNDQSPLSFDVV